jgi:hypothetical protein
MADAIARFWKGFFWGPPSHRPIAWVGFFAGLAVLALPVVIARFGHGGAPIFLLSLVFVGLAETGWGIELLPRGMAASAGWGRLARWACALVGLALGVISVVAQIAPLWFAAVIAAGALLLVFEMAPGGFANRA